MNIYIMALEPLDTRYTGQWFDGFPALLNEACVKKGREDVSIINVAGEQVASETTNGAFLNFSATNIWKNTQINTMAEYFSNGTIKAGDKIIFTDAWHTGVIQMKYMSELLDIPVEIHSMWHAGSYDPQDFLGRKVKDKDWSFNFERSIFFASDFNYFATMFHQELFLNTIFDLKLSNRQERAKAALRCVISGQPHNVLTAQLAKYKGTKKRNLVIFPHRVAPEKQPEIFRDLAEQMPDVDFVICQDQKLSKEEYHQLLAESKIVFSANLQETLGISAMEGILVGSLPFLPNRLSYTEMYDSTFLYPSNWTTNFESYQRHRGEIIQAIRFTLDRFDTYKDKVEKQEKRLLEDYLYCGPMVEKLLNG